GVRLSKITEQARQLFFGHTDACVDNLQHQLCGGGLCFKRNSNPNLAFLGKFAGIADKIQENLLDASAVLMHDADRMRRIHEERVASGGCQRFCGIENTRHEFLEVEFGDVDLHPTSLYFGQIEDIVDQRQKVPAGRHDADQIRYELRELL